MNENDLKTLLSVYESLGTLTYKLDGEYWLDYDSCEIASNALHESLDCIRCVLSELFSYEVSPYDI